MTICNALCYGFKDLVFRNGRTIGMNLPAANLIKRPEWCPRQENNMVKGYKSWYTIKRTLNYNDIKPNTWYHIPPVNGKKRCDIYVIRRNQYSVEYKRKEDINSQVIRFLYEYDIESKFMSEIKSK